MIDIFNAREIKAFIDDWEVNPYHQLQETGIRYYEGDHDILHPEKPAGKVRYYIKNGVKTILTGMINTRIVDNMYAQMVQQKVNYLFSKPLLVDSESDAIKDQLRPYFGREFLDTLKDLATDFLNCGIAYLHPFYDEEQKLSFMVFPGSEIIPCWKDERHKELLYAIRVYSRVEYKNGEKTIKKYASIFTQDRLITYVLDRTSQIVSSLPYIETDDPERPFLWGKVPLIPFKANSREIPLLQKCKSIQDNLNTVLSTYQDALLETQDTSLTLVSGAGGEDPAELRHNLSTYRLIYMQNTDSVASDIKLVQPEVKKDNYELMLKILRRSMVENCSGFEVKDERESGNNLNEMNIKSMYINLDLDANNIETEFQYSISQLLYFLNVHFQSIGLPTINVHDVSILTDRDTIVNMESQISMATQLYGKVSLKTFLSMLSVVDNVEEEYKRIMEEGTYNVHREEKSSKKEGSDGESK